MKWKLFEGETLVNTIEAQEDFCIAYCQEMGYTYELIPEPDPEPEAPLTADRDYEPGEYLTVDGTLYRVLLPVFAGSPITPGTNVTETTIEAEMAMLNKEE